MARFIRAGGCKQVTDAASLAEAVLASYRRRRSAGHDDGARRWRHRGDGRGAPAHAGRTRELSPAEDHAQTCLLRRRSGGIARSGALASALAPLGPALWPHGRARASRASSPTAPPSRHLHRQFHRRRRRQDPDRDRCRVAAQGARREARFPHPRLWRRRAKDRCSSQKGRAPRRWATSRCFSPQAAPTMVSADRAAGAKAIEATDAECRS